MYSKYIMSLGGALCRRRYNSFGVALISRLRIFFVERREKGCAVTSAVPTELSMNF